MLFEYENENPPVDNVHFVISSVSALNVGPFLLLVPLLLLLLLVRLLFVVVLLP